MKRIPRRIFTAEFKREAIKLITEQGLTLAEAGKKLDVVSNKLTPFCLKFFAVTTITEREHQAIKLADHTQ